MTSSPHVFAPFPVRSGPTPRRQARCAGGLGAVGLAAALLAPAGALAGVGDILNTEVTARSTNVTYSAGLAGGEPLRTYIGYTFTTTYSGTTNTTNFVYLQGLILATDRDERVQFDAANSDPRCSAATVTFEGKPATQLTCQVARQFKPGDPAVGIEVVFVAPEQKLNGVADRPGEDLVTLIGDTLYAEGATDGSPVGNDTVAWVGPGFTRVPVVTLGTSNPTNVRSVVPKGGVKLYTGERGEPRVDGMVDDPFATKVDVPAGSLYSTADITEPTTGVVQGIDGCNNFTRCYSSRLTIPGTFSPYLSVRVRQDATTLVPGFKLGNLLIAYESDRGVVSDLTVAGHSCTRSADGSPQAPTTVDGNGDPIPCIVECKVFKKTRDRSDPEWTSNLAGDVQCWLINSKNGTYRIK
jgi:hypothetical protein